MPDLGVRQQLEYPFGHSQTGAKDGHDAENIGQDATRGPSQRGGDVLVQRRQISRCLGCDQNRKRPHQVTELGRARVHVT